jgi:DMSO/TMAO reductase YedYZ molybdopterin-dependent catalytic subunit
MSAGAGVGDGISIEELQLAARNHGMPLEALRWTITPLGLHYLLIHYDIPAVDLATWRLTIGGRVRRELSLSLEDLREREQVRLPVTFECAGNGRARLTPRPISQPWLSEAVGTAEWAGTPLRPLLVDAGVLDDAVEVLFSGLDHGIEAGVEQHYERSLTLEEALGPNVLLAYAIGAHPLPPQHGSPLRLVVPGWYGMANVKWLSRITAVDEPFRGYQQETGYRIRRTADEPGEPLTRMMPRALMVPPGIPDFLSRRRSVAIGTHVVTGRAWSGWGPIRRVEVSADGGATWADARLEDGPSPWAWCSWSFDWIASAPGEVELRCRATDGAGNRQPDEPGWNVGGYANNAVQRISLTVQPSGPTVPWLP